MHAHSCQNLRAVVSFPRSLNPSAPPVWNARGPDFRVQVTADGDDEGETRIGDPRLRGDPELRVGNLIGEGNALIDTEEYQDADSSMGEAQREVVDRI